MDRVYLSIVVPAYNEESRIGGTLRQVIDFLGSQPYNWEIVVADDGSTDDTPRLVAELSRAHSGLRLLSLRHGGKGWAVKNAMLASRGEYRVLCDADLSVPIEQVERLLPPRLHGVDVALGSRDAPGARRIGEPWRRRFMGRLYNTMARLLATPGLRDTQCGFKCFREEVVPDLFQRQTMHGFGFDVEVLFLARKNGLVLREVAVDWYYRNQSKVRPFRDSVSMIWDLLRIRWRYTWDRRGALN